VSELKKRLKQEKPDLYKSIIAQALKERMDDYGLDLNDLDNKTQQIINGEITDVNEVETTSEEAVKEIGTKGAKNK
jgi:hypothetical protein